jgi:hypothetical protein
MQTELKMYSVKHGVLSQDETKLLIYTNADKHENNSKHKQTKHTGQRAMGSIEQACENDLNVSNSGSKIQLVIANKRN